MIRRWPSLAVLSTTLASSSLAGHGDHLEVPDSVFSSYDFSLDYEYWVRERLTQGAVNPVAAMVTMPSFFPEWAVFLVREPGEERGAGRAVLHVNEAKAPIWTADDPSSVGVRRRSVEIPEDMAALAGRAWLAMLYRVRHPEPTGTFGLDGVTYQFWAHAEAQGWQGQIWSPPRFSPAGQLIDLGMRLRGYLDADEESRPGLQLEFSTAARRLIAEVTGDADLTLPVGCTLRIAAAYEGEDVLFTAANVILEDSRGERVASGWTGQNGVVVFKELTIGETYQLHLSQVGMAPYTRAVECHPSLPTLFARLQRVLEVLPDELLAQPERFADRWISVRGRVVQRAGSLEFHVDRSDGELSGPVVLAVEPHPYCAPLLEDDVIAGLPLVARFEKAPFTSSSLGILADACMIAPPPTETPIREPAQQQP